MKTPTTTANVTTVIAACLTLANIALAQSVPTAPLKPASTDAILLTPAEIGLLCVLMLRGPQTLAELRTRTERFQPFESLAEVEEAMQILASRQPQPLVVKLPRLPGTKEPRYSHLLSGPIDVAALASAPSAAPAEPATLAVRAENERISQLESDSVALRSELADLRQQFAEFRKQFE